MTIELTFTDKEKEQANLCLNIDRIHRILDSVYDYAYMNNNEDLKKIIEDYLNLKEV